MSVQHPDHHIVATALEMANRAPSLHNSQPWLWKVGSQTVHLYAQPGHHLPHTDPDGRDMMVSCGAALHHCVVAFAALCWRAVVHRIPNPAEPDHLASLELHRASPSDAEVSLASAIPWRRTDRRPYTGAEVGLGDIALMGARAARYGVTMRHVNPTPGFRALLSSAAQEHSRDPLYQQELAGWSGKHAADDGVPARNVPRPDPDAVIPGRLFADAQLAVAHGPARVADHAKLLALGTTTDDTAARLRAGEATSAVLLTATTRGLATCLFSEPLEVGETRDGLAESIFDGRSFPQMLIRVGRPAAGAQPPPLTPRRPVAQTVVRLGDEQAASDARRCHPMPLRGGDFGL